MQKGETQESRQEDATCQEETGVPVLKKVFIVVWSDYDIHDNRHVFSKRENAEAFITSCSRKERKYLYLEEYEVDDWEEGS